MLMLLPVVAIVPLHPALSQALLAWRREFRYSHDADWVFTSNKTRGKTPRTPGALSRRAVIQ
jgi:integrase